MTIPNVVQDWLRGCGDLLAYDRIPGYRRLPWFERKRLDLRFILSLILSHSFWRGAFGVGVASTLVHVLIWRTDIDAPQADLLRTLPVFLPVPWIMSARRKKIVSLLRFRETAHRQTRRDR
jgi:hypothetical protein